MPKTGSTVGTPEGKGVVVSSNMLKMEVRVKIEKDGALVYRDFPVTALNFKKGGAESASDDESDKILQD